MIHHIAKSRLVLALLVVAAAAGCANPMRVRSGFDRGATLAGRSSYEFRAADTYPAGYSREAVTPAVSALAQQHIERELANRGYQKRNDADLVVRLSTGRREVVKHRSTRRTRFVEADSVETQGALVVDVFDRQTEQRLYHGVAHDVVAAGVVDDRQIEEAVRRIFEAVPPAS